MRHVVVDDGHMGVWAGGCRAGQDRARARRRGEIDGCAACLPTSVGRPATQTIAQTTHATHTTRATHATHAPVPEEIGGLNLLPQVAAVGLPVGRLPVEVDLDEGPQLRGGGAALVHDATLRVRLQRRGVVDQCVASQPRAVVLRPAPGAGEHLAAGDEVLGLCQHALTVRVRLVLHVLDPPDVRVHQRLHVGQAAGREQQGLHGQRRVALPVVVVRPTGRVGVRRGHHGAGAVDVDVVEEIPAHGGHLAGGERRARGRVVQRAARRAAGLVEAPRRAAHTALRRRIPPLGAEGRLGGVRVGQLGAVGTGRRLPAAAAGLALLLVGANVATVLLLWVGDAGARVLSGDQGRSGEDQRERGRLHNGGQNGAVAARKAHERGFLCIAIFGGN